MIVIDVISLLVCHSHIIKINYGILLQHNPNDFVPFDTNISLKYDKKGNNVLKLHTHLGWGNFSWGARYYFEIFRISKTMFMEHFLMYNNGSQVDVLP